MRARSGVFGCRNGWEHQQGITGILGTNCGNLPLQGSLAGRTVPKWLAPLCRVATIEGIGFPTRNGRTALTG